MQTTGLQVNKLPSNMWRSINQSAAGMNRTVDGALPSGRDSADRQPSDWNGGMNSSESTQCRCYSLCSQKVSFLEPHLVEGALIDCVCQPGGSMFLSPCPYLLGFTYNVFLKAKRKESKWVQRENVSGYQRFVPLINKRLSFPTLLEHSQGRMSPGIAHCSKREETGQGACSEGTKFPRFISASVSCCGILWSEWIQAAGNSVAGC